MYHKSIRHRSRRGAVAVETALTLTVFSLMLFGIFEYCRYLFILHVTNHAAREGVRYASVNVTTEDNTFDTTTSPTTGKISIQAYVLNRLGGADKQIAGYVCNIYPVDNAGLALNPIVVRPKSKSTTVFPDPTLSTYGSDVNKVDWNLAAFPERLAVQISGTFTPFLPNLTLMPTLPVRVIALTGAEG